LEEVSFDPRVILELVVRELRTFVA